MLGLVKYLYGKTCIIFSFGNINFDIYPSKNTKDNQYLSTLEDFCVHNGKEMQNLLKISDYRKTLLFCEYLRNKISDLYIR